MNNLLFNSHNPLLLTKRNHKYSAAIYLDRIYNKLKKNTLSKTNFANPPAIFFVVITLDLHVM